MKRTKILFTAIAVLAIISTMVFTSCAPDGGGGGGGPLIGTWVASGYEITFKADGTMRFIREGENWDHTYDIEITDTEILITDEPSNGFTYTLEGGILTLNGRGVQWGYFYKNLKLTKR
ncbi:MAG: hypothetical protein LBM77_05335 [Spirochaetaceae bacterium]|jgi:hypothetical protein|nr:hypothetical protein [Spirochaetaceae bacterium]